MRKTSSLLLALLLATTAAAQTAPSSSRQPAPQQQAPAPTPAADSDDDNVVRVTTNLVQFDAVVNDSRGRAVTDLLPEEFEIFVNGRRQELTNFSYVSAGPGANPAPRRSPETGGGLPPAPAAPLKPGQVRRTIALVADDLNTSWESIHSVRRALKKFVDEQMQPGDLVAVVRTSAGMGALQQFTSDRRLLYRAIEGVRWNPRGSIGSFAAVADDPLDRQRPDAGGRDGGGGPETRDDAEVLAEGARLRAQSAAESREARERAFTVGALGALGFLMRAMEGLPGRKSIVMFSEGFVLYDLKDPGKNLRIREELRRLVDLANRTAVVVYPIDPRGVTTLALTAEDSTGGRPARAVQELTDSRRSHHFDTQDPLAYMARGTGGLFVSNTNDLSKGLGSVLDDQRGYYLIGFRPGQGFFEPSGGRGRFNELRVQVKRPGMRVRTRAGFLGVSDAEARSVRLTPVQQLVRALASPFASGDVPVRLTSLFVADAARNLSINSLMHVDMSSVRFTEEADGWHKAVISVFALTFGEGGEVVDVVNRTETVRARAEGLERVRSGGLVYVMRVPVRSAGAYQLRVAVRDAADERLGSASQYVEVPDLKKARLTLSGVIIQASDISAPAASGGGAGGAMQAEGFDPLGSPAVRRFRQGMEVSYYFNVYNARPDRVTGRPRLQMQMRLFRDGRAVHSGPPVVFNLAGQSDMKNLQWGTRMRLDRGFVPGEYLLQVAVTDLLAPEGQGTATQWADFEIVK